MSRRGPGLDGLLSEGEEGERMASSTSGGVLSNDDVSEGEGGKRERSDSKFRNWVQSELKLGRAGCDRSSRGISNKAEMSSTNPVRSLEGTL